MIELYINLLIRAKASFSIEQIEQISRFIFNNSSFVATDYTWYYIYWKIRYENRLYFAAICKVINSRHRRKKRSESTDTRETAKKWWRVWLNVVEEINEAAVYIKARTASLRINDINKINLGIPELFIIRLKCLVPSSLSRSH